MDKKANLPIGLLITIIIVLAMIVWFIFFSGSIRTESIEIIKLLLL